MKKTKKDEQCFYCDGTGKIHYKDNPKEYTCTVCNGSGVSYLKRYKNRTQGHNRCKYCGRACYGYACRSCLDKFEKEGNNEDTD